VLLRVGQKRTHAAAHYLNLTAQLGYKPPIKTNTNYYNYI